MRNIALGIVAVSALLLSACANNAADLLPTVTVTQTVPDVSADNSGMSNDDLYMSLLASEGIRASRETSIEVAYTICDALDEGYDKAVLAMLAVDAGFSDREAAALIAAAVVVYCPEHSDV